MNSNYSTFQYNSHKKEKIIIILLMFFSAIMIGILGYFLYLDIQSRPLIDYPKYTLSTTEWTSNNVIITILPEDNKISSYSFDGGKTFINTNTYEISDNGEVYIMVKDINGKNSKMLPVSINFIDRENPIISFENNTVIQVGSRFSLKNGVHVYDDHSGLSGNYVVTPSSIDTSVPGEYLFKYTAFDKVGNYTEKTRKIIITEVKGTTYYRYRDAAVENYQCDGYQCSCVVTESAKINKTCPSGYTFGEPDKCCQTCYKTCKRTIWSEWSDWTTNKVTPSALREVETKVE